MENTMHTISDVAFTPAVKAIQEQRGSRSGYARMEEKGGWSSTVTDDLATFLADRDSFYLGSASADGQPYIQHRGGPPGFLKVIDEKTLAFADFNGNRQYISTGNFSENDRAFIFLMDYANRHRIKIWGRARISSDEALLKRVVDPHYKGKPEQAMVFEIDAWDVNCPQHIPRKLSQDELNERSAVLLARIADLEGELADLRQAAS
jgi:uncharacterized protein